MLVCIFIKANQNFFQYLKQLTTNNLFKQKFFKKLRTNAYAWSFISLVWPRGISINSVYFEYKGLSDLRHNSSTVNSFIVTYNWISNRNRKNANFVLYNVNRDTIGIETMKRLMILPLQLINEQRCFIVDWVVKE